MCGLKSFVRAMFLLGVAVELEAELPIFAPFAGQAVADRYINLWQMLDAISAGARVTDEQIDRAADAPRQWSAR